MSAFLNTEDVGFIFIDPNKNEKTKSKKNFNLKFKNFVRF